MKSDTIKRLYRANLIAAVLGLVFLFIFLTSWAETYTSWGNGRWASEQIDGAKTPGELTLLFKSAISSVHWAQMVTQQMGWLVLVAAVGAFLLCCMNVYRLGKLGTEISKNEPPAS